MSDVLQQLQVNLDQLAHELQCANLWGNEVPTPKQLMSSQPFCVDTLKFEQWLQWIFIPKLGNMIAMPNFSGLPNQSDIHTMAEHTFKEYAQDTDTICAVLKRIDDGLNSYPTSTKH